MKTPLAERVSSTLNRMIRAWERAQETMRVSRELRRDSEARRSGQSKTQDNDTDVVWASGDAYIRCRVVFHAQDQHEVIVTVRGDVLSSRTFADPVEATDEAQRLRKMFIG